MILWEDIQHLDCIYKYYDLNVIYICLRSAGWCEFTTAKKQMDVSKNKYYDFFILLLKNISVITS